MNNLFNFAEPKKLIHSPIGKKRNLLKKYFFTNNKLSVINILLVVVLIFLFLLALISLFLSNKPYSDNEKLLGVNENIGAFFTVTYKKISYAGEKETNQITLEIYKNIKLYNIPHKIETNVFGKQEIIFNPRDYLNVIYGRKIIFFGTDSFGNDVFIYSLKLFITSTGIASLIFFFELILGMYLGIYFAINQNKFFRNLLKILNVFISIPDVIFLILVSIFIRNINIIYLFIFFSGVLRMLYWSYQYSYKETNSDYFIALLANNVSINRIIFKHLFLKILGRILILFMRRIGYIIFLIATLEFIGAPLKNNIAIVLKNNWTTRDENVWKIIFPTFYLFIFLIITQLIATRIAKTLDEK